MPLTSVYIENDPTGAPDFESILTLYFEKEGFSTYAHALIGSACFLSSVIAIMS